MSRHLRGQSHLHSRGCRLTDKIEQSLTENREIILIKPEVTSDYLSTNCKFYII